jgi:predicted esterase
MPDHGNGMNCFRIRGACLVFLAVFQIAANSQPNVVDNRTVAPETRKISDPRLAGEPSYITVTDVRGYKALVLVPVNTAQAIDGKLPAILFLHGYGSASNDLATLKKEGFPRNLEGDQQFPFIFIMPQCPPTTEWYYTNVDNVNAMRMFLDDILARFPIDPDRLYISGLSMGGIGSWYFAINLPTRFAALVPVAFRGDGWSPSPAKDIPVWAFHGTKDNVIPLTKAQALVDQFKDAGGSVRFTIYPDGGHDGSTWTVTYNNQDVYDWMLRKKRATPAAVSTDSWMPAPHEFSLDQNFPNPFNPSTTIGFGLPEASAVSLTVYDVLGREVASLVDADALAAGYHRYDWNASGLSSGMYFYRLSATSSAHAAPRNFIQVRKLSLQK